MKRTILLESRDVLQLVLSSSKNLRDKITDDFSTPEEQYKQAVMVTNQIDSI
jgi:hypothetical protein